MGRESFPGLWHGIYADRFNSAAFGHTLYSGLQDWEAHV